MNTAPVFIELPSAPMEDMYRTIRQLVGSDLSFFITGETGVGKEGIARYIHENGPRRDKPFVALNCGRFTAELLQSELFGHEEGAFTGASHRRQGAFERANGGVLFLDEIAEMPLEAQKMLLRLLDAKTFTRLGGNETLTADFHIIAATNRNIAEAVLKAEFRPDLYYRLMGVMLDIPPLRERPEDIAPVAEALLANSVMNMGKMLGGLPRRHSLALNRQRGLAISDSLKLQFKQQSHSQRLTHLKSKTFLIIFLPHWSQHGLITS